MQQQALKNTSVRSIRMDAAEYNDLSPDQRRELCISSGFISWNQEIILMDKNPFEFGQLLK